MIHKITQFHENEKLVNAAQTLTGRLCIWIVGIALLIWHDVNVLMYAAFSLVLLFPDRRRYFLLLAAVGLVAGHFLGWQDIEIGTALTSPETIEFKRWVKFAMQFIASILFLTVLVLAANRFNQLPRLVRQHPLVLLHFVICIGLALSNLPQMGLLSLGLFILWRASYMFKSAAQGKTEGLSIRDHFFYLVPVFGGTNTPFGKGLDYLGRHEAQDREAFTRSQLAGIKLLIVAIVLTLVLGIMETLLHGRVSTFPDQLINGQVSAFSVAWLNDWSLKLPQMTDLVQANIAASIPLAWISIYIELFRVVFVLAIWGHIVIGSLRLLGYNVFRNTYKPLLAESIVEFWNRFYYYFKELLVEFFFYPAFFRSTWASPRLRMFLAVFAAAFVGNLYYHMLPVLTNLPRLYTDGFAAFWANWAPRFIYSFLLACGIWISMLRQQEIRKKSARLSGFLKFRAIAGVWTFYGLIHIWNIKPRNISVEQRFNFLVSLIGF